MRDDFGRWRAPKKKRPDNIVAGGVSLSPEAICSGFKFIHNCILLLNTNYLNKLWYHLSALYGVHSKIYFYKFISRSSLVVWPAFQVENFLWHEQIQRVLVFYFCSTKIVFPNSQILSSLGLKGDRFLFFLLTTLGWICILHCGVWSFQNQYCKYDCKRNMETGSLRGLEGDASVKIL